MAVAPITEAEWSDLGRPIDPADYEWERWDDEDEWEDEDLERWDDLEGL